MARLNHLMSLAALALLGIAYAAPARAASVVYSEQTNNGTRVTTTTSGTTVTPNIPTPYLNGNVAPQGSGWVVTFTPSTDFRTTANNTQGILSDVFDGKIDFTLTFDAPVHVHFILNEGGTWGKTGAGAVFLTAGGNVHQPGDPNPITGTGNLLPTFGNGTWSATEQFPDYVGNFSVYKFSIDNFLDSEAPAEGSSAFLWKDHFNITITTDGGGEGNSTPLPLASVGGAGLAAMALLLRKKFAR